MNIEQAKLLITATTPIVTVLSVIIGGKIAYKSNLKSQHEIIKKQIILSKLELIKQNISEITRGMALITLNLSMYCKDKISKDEFIEKDNEYQEIIRIAKRQIWINKVYIKGIEKELDEIDREYTYISNFIYDNFHIPKLCKKDLYEIILKRYNALIIINDSVAELVDKEIIKELNSRVSKLKF
ncbi:hypothetical protein [Paraclostridium sordellii]|uniref:hypothetical protein n=1 Tax=Paraclostridium sordellii TaxID=1505 RepID=UPI0005E2E816|nr:hypothetical protein [Paeniclostridium sordellii]CEN75459.1 Uncharacterised protein [[Clostridium] sordellii] [Paeniclostridium sordellii]CEO25231.1 Uncharacterised protein [[Clostridium] sordellii] [Paeniclostridium sordellii]